jgi:hypothetical protein
MVGMLAEPGEQVLHRGLFMPAQPAIGQDMAHQAAVIEPFGLSGGGLDLAPRLQVEDTTKARRVRRR